MQPNELEKIPLRVEAMYMELQDRIMQDVMRRLQKTGGISSTADYQIERISILGNSTEFIESEIKRLTGKRNDEIWQIYEDVIDKEYTRNKELYEQINRTFIPYEDNAILQGWTKAIVSQTQNDIINLTGSLGFSLLYGGKRHFTPLSEYYQKYLDRACVDVVTGAFDYGTVLRRVIKEMTDSGIRTIDYATGYSSRVTVAARRAVMTGVNQLSAKINDQVATDLGTDHFEVTYHAGARPSHWWGGMVFTRKELESVCGLGRVDGLCGANCRHNYMAFIPGVSVRTYTDEQLAELHENELKTKNWNGKSYTSYEATQKQRSMETSMRAQRERVKLLQYGKADPEDVMLAKARYQAQLNEYAAFSKKMGIPQQRERIYLDLKGRVAPSKKSYNQVAGEAKSRYNKDRPIDNINLYEKDRALEKEIRTGKIPTRIESGKQGKHFKEHSNYINGRSYLTISEKEAQEVVNKYAGSGKKLRDAKGQWRHKEIVRADDPIGYSIDPVTGESSLTNCFTIHYSKKGVHIVPTKE